MHCLVAQDGRRHLGEIAVETDGQIVTLRTGTGRDTSFMLTREPR